MKTKERIAIARIFSDLIKADRIVDIGEMEYWGRICSKYSITKEMEVKAQEMTFTEALKTIRVSDDNASKEGFLEDCRSMTTSDGFCAHSEALIMITLILMLDGECQFSVDTISIPKSSFNFDVATALYIENEYDKEANEAIQKWYRMIYKEFQLAGFHFIYLPKVIEHYRKTDKSIFKQILSFLAPSIANNQIEIIYDSILTMSTGSFCKDILCNRLEINELRNTFPSLLVKIGNDFVGGTQYANYLKIEVGHDILETVKLFVDQFCEMLSSDIYIVKSSEERDRQFHYHGFYKQLLDIFLIYRDKRSQVLLIPHKNKITFPGIGAIADGMHRRERALYTLFLCAGRHGINFNRPRSTTELERYYNQMVKIQAQYKTIYGMFTGDSDSTPNLYDSRIRGPIIACIKKSIKKLRGLYNPDDYNIIADDNGCLSVNLEPELVFVESFDNDSPLVPLLKSDLYKRYKEVK